MWDPLGSLSFPFNNERSKIINKVVVLIIGFLVAFLGYRVYAKYIDTEIIKSDPKKATPAKMYMDGVDFMPTNKSILFGYQFKSIAGRRRLSDLSSPSGGDGFLFEMELQGPEMLRKLAGTLYG